MFSKQFREKHVLGIVLLFFLAFSFYWSMVQIVNAITCQDLVESLSLLSRGNGLTEGNKFQISDILVVSASAKEGDSYLLSFYNQSSLILSKGGEIYGNKIEVEVPLYPPKFKAKQNYIVHLQVFVNDCVLPGVTISSPPKVSFFSLASTSTKLMLEKAYDETNHELKLNAILLNDLNLPIANRTVNFYLQFNSNSSLPNIGWAFIAAAETNNEGIASLNMGCNVISGHHKLRASFEGNEDFESSCDEAYFTSENYVPIVNFVEATSHNETVTLETEITDKMGRPLFGKLFTLDFGCGDEDFVCGFTDETGHVTVCFPKPQILQESVRLNYSVGADVFTSKLSGQLELNFSDGESLGLARFGQSVPTAAVKRKIFNAFSNGYGLNVTIEPVTPYATLPSHVRAFYVSDVLYDGLEFSFFLDGVYKLAVVNVSKPKQLMENSYLYEAWMVWCPDIVGSHSVGVTVKNLDSIFGVESVLAEGSVGFMSQPAPSNLVVYHPQAIYGDTIRISVAFSGPRLYESPSSDLFYSIVLAPHVTMDGTEYVVDEGVASMPVHFYLNGTHVVRQTDEDGLAGVYCSFPGGWAHGNLNVTVVAEGGLYEEKRVHQLLNLTKVHILDLPSLAEDKFQFNYTLKDLKGAREYTPIYGFPLGFSKQPMYVEEDGLLKVEARLFNMSLWNAPVSVISAWLFKFGITNTTGQALIPSDPLGNSSNYLRLSHFHDLRYSDVAKADIYRDDEKYITVDMRDVCCVARAFGAYGPNARYFHSPADPLWDPRADVNGDNVVNMRDIAVVARYFGSKGEYLDVDYSDINLEFFSGDRSGVDSQGFVHIPSGVTGFTVFWHLHQPVGAVLEFCSIKFEDSCITNKAGLAEVSFTPPNLGFANPPRNWYIIQVKLPSSFEIIVTEWKQSTGVYACANVFKYVEVVLRPTNVSLSHITSQKVVVDLPPADDAYVCSVEPDMPHNGNFLSVACSHSIEEPVPVPWLVEKTFIRFDLSSIPAHSYVLNASMWLYHYESVGDECANVSFPLYQVKYDWSEANLKWVNQPSLGLCVSNKSFADSSWYHNYGWWVWDLTDMVMSWLASAHLPANFGVAMIFSPVLRNDVVDSRAHFYSKESLSKQPFLHVEYIPPNVTMVAQCRDALTGDSLNHMKVDFMVDENPVGSAFTNASGIALKNVVIYEYKFHTLKAAYSGNYTFSGDNASLVVDYRLPSRLLVWTKKVGDTRIRIGNNSQVNVDVLSTYEFSFELYPPRLSSDYNYPQIPLVKVYINQTYNDYLSWDAIDKRFTWNSPNVKGVTFFMFEFIGLKQLDVHVHWNETRIWKPCTFLFVVNAQAIPVALEFGVSPTEFEVNTNILLWCRAVDVRSGQPVGSGFNVSFQADDSSIGIIPTNSSGIATIGYYYDSELHVFCANTDPNQAENKKFATTTVMLIVGTKIKLILNVSREETNIKHKIYGWLRKYDNTPVPNRRVILRINSTIYDNVFTDSNGYFSLTIDLEPIQDRQTRYEIIANYTELANTKSMYSHLPDGTQYEVCRTTQYTFRPVANTTFLTVLPRSTEATYLKKTPEEMQEEAKQKGWLSVWNEWSIFPPWCWLHMKAAVGGATIHVALSPAMPFWPGTVEFTGLKGFMPPLPSTPLPPSPPPPPPEETSTILRGMVTSVVRNLLIIGAAAVASANVPALPAAIAAIGIYGGGSGILIAEAVQTYYSSEWGAHTKAHAKLASLMVTFACAAIAVEMSFSAGVVFKTVVTSVLSAFLAALINPSSLETALQSSCFSVCISLFALLALLKIPNPSFTNVYFRPAFLGANLALFATTMATIVGLPL